MFHADEPNDDDDYSNIDVSNCSYFVSRPSIVHTYPRRNLQQSISGVPPFDGLLPNASMDVANPETSTPRYPTRMSSTKIGNPFLIPLFSQLLFLLVQYSLLC